MARMARGAQVSECRRCAAFCDRVIRPASCVAVNCPSLYAYDDALSGRRYMGCMHNVFAVEIDVELFAEAERTRAGFGTVKLASSPLPRCAFTVEQAFEGVEDRCTNRRFFDLPDDGPYGLRVLDLRDRLSA